MTYIDYASLSPIQRLEFNKTGECPIEFVLTQEQYERSVEQLCEDNDNFEGEKK